MIIPPVSLVTPTTPATLPAAPPPLDTVEAGTPAPGTLSPRDAMRLMRTRSHAVRVPWTVPAGGQVTAAALTPQHAAVGLSGGAILLVDRRTGRCRRLAELGSEVKWLAADAAGTVYAGGEYGSMRALDPADGHVLWHHPKGRCASAPPLVRPDGSLVFGGGRLLTCVDAASGAERWSRAEWMWLDGGTPAAMQDGGLLVLTSNGLQALEADGTPRWTLPGHPTPPAVGPDGTVYVGEGWPPTRLLALDPASGAPRWTEDVREKILTAPAVGPDGSVYLALSGSHAASYSPDGRERWRVPVYTDTTSLLAHDGVDTLLVANRAIHQMWALDATTGERAWEHRTALPHVAAVGADGRFVVTDAGTVTALEDAGWRAPLRDPRPSPPPDDPTVTREGEFVVIDGVRVPVRRG